MNKPLIILAFIGSAILLYMAHAPISPKNNAVTTDDPIVVIKTINRPTKSPTSSYGLRKEVAHTIKTILNCTKKLQVEHSPILTVIDYSLPANQKRLWVFDLNQNKLLYHTYVAHGIRSGALHSNYFSNIYDSKTSSIGVYTTDNAYYGREGLSLKLNGLEKGINDNAYNRYLVMHGGWYLDEAFIKKYGRSGRSWGCPSVPEEEVKPIIETIKDRSLFVVYYPNEQWLATSRFLQCQNQNPIKHITLAKPVPPEHSRDEVLLVRNASLKERAIVTMQADHYLEIFHKKPPLNRMLRRQINNKEYIALNPSEFQNILSSHTTLDQTIQFVIPVIKMNRGYYITEMKIINLGTIHRIVSNPSNEHSPYTIYFESTSSAKVESTPQFIRWLGL